MFISFQASICYYITSFKKVVLPGTVDAVQCGVQQVLTLTAYRLATLMPSTEQPSDRSSPRSSCTCSPLNRAPPVWLISLHPGHHPPSLLYGFMNPYSLTADFQWQTPPVVGEDSLLSWSVESSFCTVFSVCSFYMSLVPTLTS